VTAARTARAIVVAAVLTLGAGAASVAAGTLAGRNCAAAARDIALFGFFVWGPLAFVILVVVCYLSGLRLRSPLPYVALGVIAGSVLVVALVLRSGTSQLGLCS
jgi:hypothetical protein